MIIWRVLSAISCAPNETPPPGPLLPDGGARPARRAGTSLRVVDDTRPTHDGVDPIVTLVGILSSFLVTACENPTRTESIPALVRQDSTPRRIFMSLHPQPDYPIPEETRRVAHAAFPDGNLCLRIADELGNLYRDDQFAGLFPDRGQPALAPARLALASVLQFVEGLSDRQAADAVRG